MPPAIGDLLPSHTLPDTNGTSTKLLDPAAKATVVVFTCNHCPYAAGWQERLNAVAQEYADRDVRTLFVNSNDATNHPDDSFEAMRARFESGALAAPYLHDADQTVASTWGAESTPHVFVVDDSARLVYRGAPDADHTDETQGAAWLRAALDDVLAGRDVRQSEAPAVGCSIKWQA